MDHHRVNFKNPWTLGSTVWKRIMNHLVCKDMELYCGWFCLTIPRNSKTHGVFELDRKGLGGEYVF